jgi:hypothetical protein
MTKKATHGWTSGKLRAAELMKLNAAGKVLNESEVIDRLRAEGWPQSDLTLWNIVRDAASIARKAAGIVVRGQSAYRSEDNK